ncbi:uncharacterized protein LOC143225370 isoform X3 [Tachypleus tridentatus]|uniref:uncharacterized protein LOC143225370 isoform X3 n=1 Tax=Tachypleus tridentatus TaxID=6853 RepID=UPI003FD448DB
MTNIDFLLTKFLGIEKFITFLHEHRNIFFLPGDGTVHTTLDPVKKEPVLSKLKFLKTVNKNLDTSTINNRDLPSLQTGKPQSTRYVDVKECNNGAVQNSQVNSAFIHVEGELGQQSDVLSSPTQSISTGESQYTDSCCSVKPQVTMACESTSENYCETIYSTENEGDSKEISANLPNLPEEHVKIWQFVKEVVGFVVYVGKEGSIIQCVLNNAKGRIYCLVYYFNNSYDYDDRGWKVPTLSVLKVGSLVRCIIDDNIGYQFSDKVMMFAKNIILQGNSGTNGVPCSLPEMTETTDCSNDRKVENLVSRFLTKTDGNNDDNSVVEKKRTNLSCTKTSNVNNTTHLSVLSDNFYSTYFEDEKLNARDSFHILSTPDEAVTQPEPSTGPNLHTQQPLFVFSETNCSRSGAASEEAKESNASVGNTDPYSQQERSSRDNQQDNRCEGTIDDVDTTYLAGFQDATKILMQVQMEIGSILAQKRNRYKRPEDILDDNSKDYSSEKGFYENFQSKIGHQTKTEIITLNSSCQTISTGPVYIKKLFC